MEVCSPSATASVADAKANFLPVSLVRSLILSALLTGLVLRFIGLSYPPYDSHRFRQTQTLSTIEAFHKDGIDLLHARAIYMGYPGTFVLELPVFQALAALLYKCFGAHLEIVRILNIVLGAASTWLLYRITAFVMGRTTAILAALIYWLAPLNVLYQRSMLLDPTAVFLALVSFYCLARLFNVMGGQSHAGSMTFVIFAAATWFTAMIKALYLWPAVLLLAYVIISRGIRLDSLTLRVIAIFAISGFCFVAWNYYASRINGASPITRGIRPTSCLGVGAVLETDFYITHLIRRPKWWLGVFGAMLFPIGLLAGCFQSQDKKQAAVFWTIALIPPTYLLTFADINGHDYYQLLITPFLAIVSAYGLCWLGSRWFIGKLSARTGQCLVAAAVALFLAISIFTYSIWLKVPRISEQILKFRELCAGKFPREAPAMVFVANANYAAPPNSYIPEFLYAAGLWGYGRTVKDTDAARSQFEQYVSGFTRLDYVLFYGTEKPQWLPQVKFHIAFQDDTERFYVFKRVPE
jgi:4-amino-4-deoxy-L-arabinose transferase-like glycosyltransferase